MFKQIVSDGRPSPRSGSMIPPTTRRGSDWLVPAMLVLLALIPSLAGVVRLAELTGGASVAPDNARFVAMPVPIVLHVLAALPFGIVGAFQFSPGLRRRSSFWHRSAGWVLLPLGAVTAVTGLWMTLTYPWPEGDGIAVFGLRLGFGTAMLVALMLGVNSLRQREFVEHGRWMIRAYAIGLGAGTQVLTHVPWLVLVGQPTEGPRAVLMGAGWVINLIAAEWVIRRHAAMRPAVGLRSKRLRWHSTPAVHPFGHF